jgi:integrase
MKGMPKPEKNVVHEKIPPTKEEMEKLIHTLELQEDWMKVAYLKYTFDTGCRRAESIQLLKEVINYEPIVKERVIDGKTVIVKYYLSNKTRCKGRGNTGKIRRLAFSEDTMKAIKKWLEVRGEDDCPYVFVSKHKGKVKQISDSSLNKWASGTFSKILGRRINPHIFRAAKATISVIEDGKSAEAVQHLLGHENLTTTMEHYIIKDDVDDVDELFI